MRTLPAVPTALATLLALAPPAAARDAAEAESPPAAYEILDHTIPPGRKETFFFRRLADYVGLSLDTPVLVVHGSRPGPTLCLTAGIHGDELNGVEIARRAYARTRAEDLAGTIVALPMINMYGLRSGSRYMSDRRDLNRFFPGSHDGSVASLVARAIFERVIRRCGALVDLHTASFHRRNLPQIRGALDNEQVLRLARSFGAEVVLDDAGPAGSLRRAALDAGVPAIIYEAGGPFEFEEPEIARGFQGIVNVMVALGMRESGGERARARLFQRSTWLRSGSGGIFLTSLEPGDRIREGMVLGTVTDPITERREEIRASVTGHLIGMANPQFVLPGYALFHVGLDGEH
jgi:hypothetical protein